MVFEKVTETEGLREFSFWGNRRGSTTDNQGGQMWKFDPAKGPLHGLKNMIIFCGYRSEMLDTDAHRAVRLRDVVKELRTDRKGNQDE